MHRDRSGGGNGDFAPPTGPHTGEGGSFKTLARMLLKALERLGKLGPVQEKHSKHMIKPLSCCGWPFLSLSGDWETIEMLQSGGGSWPLGTDRSFLTCSSVGLDVAERWVLFSKPLECRDRAPAFLRLQRGFFLESPRVLKFLLSYLLHTEEQRLDMSLPLSFIDMRVSGTLLSPGWTWIEQATLGLIVHWPDMTTVP